MTTQLERRRHEEWLATQQEQMRQSARNHGAANVAQSQRDLMSAKALPPAFFADPKVQQAALNYQVPGADAASMRAGLASQQQDYALQRMDLSNKQQQDRMRLAAELRQRAAALAMARRRRRGRRKNRTLDKYLKAMKTVPASIGQGHAIGGELKVLFDRLSKKDKETVVRAGLTPDTYGTVNTGMIGGSKQEIAQDARYDRQAGLEARDMFRAEHRPVNPPSTAGQVTPRDVFNAKLKAVTTLLSNDMSRKEGVKQLQSLLQEYGGGQQGAAPAAQPAAPGLPPGAMHGRVNGVEGYWLRRPDGTFDRVG